MTRLLPLLLAALLGVIAIAPAAFAQESTVEPTPSATPSAPDPDLAATLAHDGDLEGAIGAYLAVTTQGTAEEGQAVRFPLARAYLDDGQIDAAVQQLDALLLEAPAGADVRAAQFLLAEALSLRGDWEGALPLYDAYIDAGGGASAYARLGLAEALARVGRVGEATREGEAALEAEVPEAARLSFELTLAQALDGSLQSAALPWYERLQRESDVPQDRALALWRAAEIRSDLSGDDNALIGAGLTIIQQYPGSAAALEAVEELPAIKGMLDMYYVAQVYYRHGRDADARSLFQQVIDAQGATPNAARASFYLAVLDENAGNIDAAVAGYARTVALDPTVELADDALWWQAKLLEQAGRDSDAIAIYEQLASGYPATDFAAEARFRVALFEYDTVRFMEAAAAFARIADGSTDDERQRALLWQGKALTRVGEDEAAAAVWQQLADEGQGEYYGLRAAALLGDPDDLEDAGIDAPAEPDWPAIEAWLAATTQENPAAALDGVLYDARWGLGQELLALGMQRRATEVFSALLEDAGRDPAALYQLARSFHDADMPHLSSRAATRLLFALPEEQRATAPADLWRLAYPAPYADLVRDVSDEMDVPDVLLLAVVRQESFFDPLAGSPAGALGLTQVIPATGEEIAQDLDVAFDVEELYRPSVSLRFGAHYLAKQLHVLDGELYQALAAYNGGPGSAIRWRESAGGDVDRYLEEIDFSQTRAYLQLVLENLARYRQLYQGLPAPELPAG
jgi:soluble lytic murein transglycosylase